MAKVKDFPKIIYVTKDGQGGGRCSIVWDSPSSSETDGDKVAIYELKEIKTLRLTSELE